MAYVLAHLSDPHVIDWAGQSPASFAGKRLTGWANFRFHRQGVHRIEVLEAVLDDLAQAEPDHVAVTGDLSSLAFDRELEGFSDLLAVRGLEPEQVSIIPGNHDAYTRRSWRDGTFLRHLSRYSSSDLHDGAAVFPFLRFRGPLAVVGVSSAVARPVFFANGLVGADQAGRVADLLGRPEVQRRFAVVLVHHPVLPYRRAAKEIQSGLLDRQRLLAALDEGLGGRDALVLSGHWHRRERHRLPISAKAWLLIAPSASRHGGGASKMAAYHLLRFEGEPGGSPRLVDVEARAFDPDLGRVATVDRFVL